MQVIFENEFLNSCTIGRKSTAIVVSVHEMMCVVFVLSDAIFLNSLCKMFGLLDSVKEALDLKRNQDEENRLHNDANGEKASEGYVQ